MGGMRMDENIYSFEKEGRRKFHGVASENDALRDFAQRLGYADMETSDFPEHRDTILNFILNLHKIIERYQELRIKESRRRIWFTILSLALLMAIPGLMIVIGLYAESGSILTAQVAAILTGLIAVHRSVSSWMDKRKVIGNFWKAESDLKTILYSFEDKWKGRAVQSPSETGTEKPGLKEEFLADARICIAQAKAIVQDEQTKFFDAVTYPAIDLGDMVKNAGDSAKALMNLNPPPEADRRERQRRNREEFENKLAEQKGRMARLETEIEHRNQLIEEKRAAIKSASQEDAEAYGSVIKANGEKIRQAEDDLVMAKSQFEALLRESHPAAS
jgi:hypothetical protein